MKQYDKNYLESPLFKHDVNRAMARTEMFLEDQGIKPKSKIKEVVSALGKTGLYSINDKGKTIFKWLQVQFPLHEWHVQ
jgi:molecular chaperone DnaK (HSP70)